MARHANNFDNAGSLGLGNGSGLISNLEVAGQLGYGIKAGALDGATPLVLPPAVIYVTHTPEMWEVRDTDKALARVMKSMFETHAKSVTGIDIGYTLESGQQPVGHDGQQMDAPTVSKRNAVQPNFTFGEITGNLCFRIIETWIWDICDPDTQISLSRVPTANLMPFTMSAYSASFVAIQYDQTMDTSRILGAIYITNVYPTGTNEFGIKREIGQASTQDRSISFTGIGLTGENIMNLARSVAARIAYRYDHTIAGDHAWDPYNLPLANPAIAPGDMGIEDESRDQSSWSGDMFPGKATPAISGS